MCNNVDIVVGMARLQPLRKSINNAAKYWFIGLSVQRVGLCGSYHVAKL